MAETGNCLRCGGPLRATNRWGYCYRSKECIAARQAAVYRAKTTDMPKRHCDICGAELDKRTRTSRFCGEHLNAGKRVKRAGSRASTQQEQAERDAAERRAALAKFKPFASAMARWAGTPKQAFKVTPHEVVCLGRIHESKTRPWPGSPSAVAQWMDKATPLLAGMGVAVSESTRTWQGQDDDTGPVTVAVWELARMAKARSR